MVPYVHWQAAGMATNRLADKVDAEGLARPAGAGAKVKATNSRGNRTLV